MNKDKLEKEKGERARKVHASFFDRCEEAIEKKYYLEAMCMEFASIEGRMYAIMRTLGFQCGTKKETREQPDIALSYRFKCLKKFLNDRTMFKDSYFKPEEIDEIGIWLKNRNDRIHGLYCDTEKYDEVMNQNKKLALQGYYYSRKMYDEANRLKRLTKKNPNILKYFTGKCIIKNKNCIMLKEYLENKQR